MSTFHFSQQELLHLTSTNFNMTTLSGLMAHPTFTKSNNRKPKPHHIPRTKNVIFYFISNNISQINSFNPKPKLKKLHNKPIPITIQHTQFNKNNNIITSPFTFHRRKKNNIPINSMFPKIDNVADKLTIIHSITSTINEHTQNNYLMHTNFPFINHPSTGT